MQHSVNLHINNINLLINRTEQKQTTTWKKDIQTKILN